MARTGSARRAYLTLAEAGALDALRASGRRNAVWALREIYTPAR